MTLRVIGTVRDYSWSRGTIFMDRTPLRRAVRRRPHRHVPRLPEARARAGSATETRRWRSTRREKGLFVTDRDSLRKFLSELIDRVYLLAYLQQIVIGVVAALGVVTALLISVLQRKRELGLLLAVGATPGQVLRSVLAEAMLMGVFGTVLGILIGLPMEWYVLKVVLVEESGFSPRHPDPLEADARHRGRRRSPRRPSPACCPPFARSRRASRTRCSMSEADDVGTDRFGRRRLHRAWRGCSYWANSECTPQRLV